MKSSRLRELFLRERARFAKRFPVVAKTKLFLSDDRPETPRDYARAYSGRTKFVVFLRRVLRLPERNVVALIRHELGHIADSRISLPFAEQRADDIAEIVTGERIMYDDRDVQTTGRGRWPRPRHLPR